MSVPYHQALPLLEGILHREWAMKGTAPQILYDDLRGRGDSAKLAQRLVEDSFYMRKDAPEIFSSGTGQIVMSLDDMFVAKFIPAASDGSHYVIRSGYYPGVLESHFALADLGFPVVEHYYVGVVRNGDKFRIGGDKPHFAICRDLRESGKYIVQEAYARILNRLANGPQLRKELKKSLEKLDRVRKGRVKGFYARVNDHATNDNPRNALLHMFFVQIDPKTNTGKLIIGDLDHVFVRYNDSNRIVG